MKTSQRLQPLFQIKVKKKVVCRVQLILKVVFNFEVRSSNFWKLPEKELHLTNHEMAINIKNKLSNETHNFECIVSDHPVVSSQKFHEIQSGDKFVACFETCQMAKPLVSAFWNIDFTVCSSRKYTGKRGRQILTYCNLEGTCLRRSQLMMESCYQALNTNCFCPGIGEKQLTFITMRNNVGISTLNYYYDSVGQYYLFNLCNKCQFGCRQANKRFIHRK